MLKAKLEPMLGAGLPETAVKLPNFLFLSVTLP